MKIGFFEKINKITNDPENSMGRLVVFMVTVTGICAIIAGIIGAFISLSIQEIIALLATGETLLVTGVLGKAKQTKNESGEK